MVGNFTELKNQFLQLWNNFSKRAKIIITVSTIIAFLGLLILVNWASRPDYTVLFNNLSSKDAGNITNRLKEQQINYKIGDGGSSILVPRSKVHQLRLDLASEGLPSGGVTGFEIFDQTQIGSTDFEQKVNYYRALSGELTRTIKQMQNVSYAKVQVTPSKDSIYKDKAKPAKASVMLKLDQYQQLSTAQVRSIANLVASSVETLDPANVTIVDTGGNLLSAKLEQEEEGNDFGNHLEMKNQLESTMEEDLNVMLTKVLGLNNFVVKVNANLNFNQRNVKSEEYEPVVGEEGIVRSRQTKEQSQEGTTTTPEGVPGTTSNIPQYQENSQQQQESESEEQIVNYEINKKVEEFVKEQGNIERLSVSVMVNEDLGDEQQEQIRRAISTAVGYNQGRGDEISVIGMPFDQSVAEATTEAQQQLEAERRRNMYLMIAGIIVALGLLFYIFRKSQSSSSGSASQTAEGIDYTVDDAESEQAATSELSEEEQAKREMQQELKQLAEEQPEEIAELVRSWMAED
ncbi:flagellar basal-body MS-ring/collar protein FliF [Halanaerobacter jeridensis]|uniref:Flagellar M-ring protein n=1 Tax=Halanaerobacter jeridensis TaxID=706427 RepID=A0A939BQW0_9FIRM|nr:flagellar basal-body MS-ring/collar protein FliF [Halanaerobacter jeridensis]MBM7555336.1 flagellar M-ring protein FliF [Halanaerobacter jeridensis]